jgi:thioredoxin-dependent peroxiredoxin
MALEIGMKAPAFTAMTDGGNEVSLSNFIGKWVVLYFYPKDNTSGCTQEACDFRDNMDSLTSTGTVVIGVSPDSVKSHKNFKEKFGLNFVLISDTDKAICNLYGIIGEKSMYGKKYLGVIRTTYVINPDGIISKVFSNVKVSGHVQELIEYLSGSRL